MLNTNTGTKLFSSLLHTYSKVLPYCLFNVFLILILTYIDRHYSGKYSIIITTQGHTFIALVVAFLLVSRVNLALGRYQQARDSLGLMYRETRELIQSACVWSAHCTDDSAREWRSELAYRVMILLRTANAVIDYPVTNVAAWDVPELNGLELEDVKRSSFLNPEMRRWAHADRSEWEESVRVPIRLAYLLRKTICRHKSRLKEPLNVQQDMRMMVSVDGFLNGYYGILRFLTTPVPFPLIQMARTFLFLYVFTIPFVMLGDKSSLLAHCFVVFLLTYGFVGLELVAIEMDNPFGDDANDFDNA
jgi:predicted membrane chloride channel (bestrophin family)